MIYEICFWGSSLATLVLVLWMGYRWRDERYLLWAVPLLVLLLAVLLATGALSPPFSAGPVPRGGSEEGQPLLLSELYFAMLLGMLSNYLYARLAGSGNARLDLGHLLAPVFVSPIVFLPLASIIETTDSTHANASHLMLFLVAFENGFFWREFFANRSKAHAAGSRR